MSQQSKPYETGCRMCGASSERLRRGLCMRHYQRFLKKTAELKDVDQNLGDAFELDCIWEGWLEPKKKGGRPKNDDVDVLDRIAREVTGIGGHGMTKRLEVGHRLERMISNQPLDKNTPAGRSSAGGGSAIETVALELQDSSRRVARNFPVEKSVDTSLDHSPDTLSNAAGGGDLPLVELLEAASGDGINSRGGFYDRFTLVMRVLFERGLEEELPGPIQWPSRAFSEIDYHLRQPGDSPRRFLTWVNEALIALRADNAAAGQLFDRLLLADQNLEDALVDAGISVSLGKKYRSLARARIKQHVDQQRRFQA